MSTTHHITTSIIISREARYIPLLNDKFISYLKPEETWKDKEKPEAYCLNDLLVPINIDGATREARLDTTGDWIFYEDPNLSHRGGHFAVIEAMAQAVSATVYFLNSTESKLELTNTAGDLQLGSW